MCLSIILFLNSGFTVHFCAQRIGGCIIVRFFQMSDPISRLKDQLYARFIFNNYRPFVNSLLATPCQILFGDGVYICKRCQSEVKKNKVPCHAVAYKLLGEWSPRELRPLKTSFQAISQRQLLLLERFLSRIIQQVFQSQDQQLYFQKSNLKRNVDSNFCSKLQKIFQVPKILFKADWLGVAYNNYTFWKNQIIEVHIFDRLTLSGFAMREFTTK